MNCEVATDMSFESRCLFPYSVMEEILTGLVVHRDESSI